MREGGGGEGGLFVAKFASLNITHGSHSHILLTGGGGGCPRDFFRSEILAKRDFLGGLWRTWGFFWVAKKTRDFWGIALFISSNQK